MAAFSDSHDFIEPASDDSASSSYGGGSFAIGSDYASTFDNESLVGSLTNSVHEHVYENGRYPAPLLPPSSFLLPSFPFRPFCCRALT